MPKILLVSADRIAADAVTDILAERHLSTSVAASIGEAVEHLGRQQFDVVITDAFGKAPPGDLDRKAMRPLLDAAHRTAVILCTDWLSEAATSEAEEHFTDIVWKPIDPDELLTRVDAALADR